MAGFRKQEGANTWHQAATNMPTNPRDTTMEDLKGLMAFAGATTNVVSNYLEENTQRDALKQIESIQKTGKATEGATKGGYRAAAALGITNWNQSRNERDLAFAKTNPTDEQLRERAMDEDRAAKEFLVSNYEYLKEDPELLKMVSMNTIENMPVLAKTREVARLEQEQTKRLTSLAERIQLSGDADPEGFSEMFKAVTSELKLDQASAKAVLVGTAIESGDIRLMELAANTKMEGSELTLGQTNGKLRETLRQEQRRAALNDAGRIAAEKDDLISRRSSGELTDEEFFDNIKSLNEKYDGRFMSVEQAYSELSKASEAYADQYRKEQGVTNAISNPTVNNTIGMKQKDKEALAISIYDEILSNELWDVPQEERTPEFMAKVKAQSVAKAAEVYAANGGLKNPMFEAMFTSASKVSPMSAIMTDDQGNEYVNPETLESLNAWSALTPIQRGDYADSQSSTLLANYDILTKAGSTPVEALKAVNEIMKRPKFVSKELQEAAYSITDDLFKPWFGRNISDSNADFINNEIQRQLLAVDGASASSVEYVKRQIEGNSTQITGGYVVLANPNMLSQKMGIHVDRVNDAIVNYRDTLKDLLESRAVPNGEDIKDYNFAIDRNRGAMYMVNSVGQPVSGTFKTLEQLGKEYSDAQDIKKAERYKGTSGDNGFGNIFYTSPTKL